MNPAEHLPRYVDAMGGALAHPVDGAAAGAVNAGQAKDAHVGAQRLPVEIGLCAGAAPAGADRGSFVHPCAAAVAINAGRGKITGPVRVGCADGGPILVEHGIAAVSRGRNRGQDMGCSAYRPQHRLTIPEGEYILAMGLAPDAGDPPAKREQPLGEARGAVAHSEDQHMRHHAASRPFGGGRRNPAFPAWGLP